MVKTKKVLSVLLTLCMLLSAVPMIAFADGDVAKIGDNGYATLQAAVDAAEAGATIEMSADTNETVTITKNLTIKGNGYTVTGATASNPICIKVTSTCDLTLDNIKLNATSSGYPVYITAQTDLTIKNSEFTLGYCSIYFKPGSNGTTVTATDTTFNAPDDKNGSSDHFGMFAVKEDDITMHFTDCVFNEAGNGTAKHAVFMSSQSECSSVSKGYTAIIDGDKTVLNGIVAWNNGYGWTDNNNIYLNDGTYTVTEFVTGWNDANVVVSGGTYTANAAEYSYIKGYGNVSAEAYCVDTQVTTEPYTFSFKKYEPRFEITSNGKTEGYYAISSFIDAIENLTANATVKLLSDIDSGSTQIVIESDYDVTIDLNGKTITGSRNGSVVYCYATDVTVTDSSEGKTGGIVNSGTYSSSKGLAVAGGYYAGNATLTVEAGNYTAVNALYVDNYSDVEINDGKFTGKIGTGYGTFAIEVNGGSFSEDVNIDYLIEGKATALTDGYYVVGDATDSDYVAQVDETKYTLVKSAIEVAGSEKTITLLKDASCSADLTSSKFAGDYTLTAKNISGGTFDCAVAYTGYPTISGGTFNKSVTAYNISGGTFNEDVTVSGSISGGTFIKALNTSASISGGTFNAAITGSPYISNGTFNVSITTSGNISGGTFSEAVTAKNISGGTFTNSVTSTGYISGGNFVNCESYTCNDGSIYGGTFAEKPDDAKIYKGYHAFENSDGTWTVKSVQATITVGEVTTYYNTLDDALNAVKSGETIKLENYKGYYSDATLTIPSGVTLDMNGKQISISNSYSVLTLNCEGATIKNGTLYASGNTNKLAKMVISNGTFEDVKLTIYSYYGTDKGTYEISGGCFNTEPDSAYIKDGYFVTETNGIYTVAKAVAEIGSTKYTSLADAIAAVPATNSETTIKMLADVDYGTFSSGNIACATVPAGKNVILDLNGHTIKASKSDASANVYVIKNEGTLEIKDSGTNGAVIMDKDSSEWSDSTDGVAVENTGKFTLTSGTLEATRTGSGMVYALDNITGGTAVVNGGKIKSSYGGIRNYPQQANSDTSLTVNAGADISARHGICVQEGASKSTTVINGGTFVGEKTDIYVDDATASITVNGGYFKGGDYGELHDCTFCFADSAKGNTDKIMKVTGGYFTSNVISDGDPRYTYTSPSLGTLVPAGKAVAANEDEATKATYSYTIGKALVCENKADSNEKYSSVDDAINDALDNKETKTIKLTDYAVVTKDVLESGKNATNKVTVENNNNVLAIVDCNDNTSTDSEAIEEFIRNDTTTAADVTYNVGVKKVEEKDIDSTKKSGVTGITSNKDLTWYSVEITKQESGETAKTVSDTVVIVPITYTYDMTNRCDLSVVRVHGDETTELTRVYTTENPQDGTYYVSGSGANTTITVYARLYSDYILASEERPDAFTNANYQASLTLNDGVALNLVINGVDTANYEADKLSVTVTGATGVGTPELKDSTITCKLADFAPAKFADSVTVTITYDSVELAKFDYSVATYCAKVFTVYNSSDDTYKLCEALLNYGKFAADFVNGNTSSTLNSGHAITVSDISIDTQDGCVSSNSNGTTSLTIDSTNAKVALNFYIKTDKELNAASINDDAGTLRILNADGDRVAKGDITIEKLTSGDYDYKVTINDMYVRQMSRAYTLQIDKLDIITSSVYTYCSDAQDQTGAEFTATLKALCKCIYAYSDAAVTALG